MPLPSEQIKMIVEQIQSKKITTEKITTAELSNIIQAIIHFLDIEEMIKKEKTRKEVKK